MSGPGRGGGGALEVRQKVLDHGRGDDIACGAPTPVKPWCTPCDVLERARCMHVRGGCAPDAAPMFSASEPDKDWNAIPQHCPRSLKTGPPARHCAV